jgi:hypothetical protein
VYKRQVKKNFIHAYLQEIVFLHIIDHIPHIQQKAVSLHTLENILKSKVMAVLRIKRRECGKAEIAFKLGPKGRVLVQRLGEPVHMM